MPKAKKDDSLKELTKIVSQGFRELSGRIDTIEEKQNTPLYNVPVKEIEKKDFEIGSTITTTTDQPESFIQPSYKQAAIQILGPDFIFGLEKIGDQEMFVVTVPDKYRNKAMIDNFITHWKTRRNAYEVDLERKYPNLTTEQKDTKMAEYDKKNSTPAIPKDQRHKPLSTIQTIVDLRKWLLLIRANIKKEMSVAKQEHEIPTDSLQEELKNEMAL